GQDAVGQVRGRIGGGEGQTLRGGRTQRCAAVPAELLRLGVLVRTGEALHHSHPFHGQAVSDRSHKLDGCTPGPSTGRPTTEYREMFPSTLPANPMLAVHITSHRGD